MGIREIQFFKVTTALNLLKMLVLFCSKEQKHKLVHVGGFNTVHE